MLKDVLDQQEPYVEGGQKQAGEIVPHLFCYEDGRPIRYPENAWKNACKAAGKPGLLIHDLKRSAVRQADIHGIDRDLSRKMAGIKTDLIHSRYNIGDEDRLAQAANKLTYDLSPDRSVVPLQPQKGAVRVQ